MSDSDPSDGAAKPSKNQEDTDDDARLRALEGKIKTLRGNETEIRPENRYLNKGQSNVLGLAFRVSVEVVSALAVGLGIGWLLDQWLDTRPWFMLTFLLLGGCAGMLNVYRVAKGFGYAVGYQVPDDAEDKTKIDEPR